MRRNGYAKSRDHLTRDHDGMPLLDAPTAAQALAIPLGTLRQWKYRGKVKPVRRGPHGAWLYRIDDLQELACSADKPKVLL